MDAYGRPSSAEILEELEAIRAARLNILKQKDVSESMNGRQVVHNGMGHLDTLTKREMVLRAELALALELEGHPIPGQVGIVQVYPIG